MTAWIIQIPEAIYTVLDEIFKHLRWIEQVPQFIVIKSIVCVFCIITCHVAKSCMWHMWYSYAQLNPGQVECNKNDIVQILLCNTTQPDVLHFNASHSVHWSYKILSNTVLKTEKYKRLLIINTDTAQVKASCFWWIPEHVQFALIITLDNIWTKFQHASWLALKSKKCLNSGLKNSQFIFSCSMLLLLLTTSCTCNNIVASNKACKKSWVNLDQTATVAPLLAKETPFSMLPFNSDFSASKAFCS